MLLKTLFLLPHLFWNVESELIQLISQRRKAIGEFDSPNRTTGSVSNKKNYWVLFNVFCICLRCIRYRFMKYRCQMQIQICQIQISPIKNFPCLQNVFETSSAQQFLFSKTSCEMSSRHLQNIVNQTSSRRCRFDDLKIT